jgi:hypothetical protein
MPKIEYDSDQWDWGKGYCKLHRGYGVPCEVCIGEGQAHVIGEPELKFSGHLSVTERWHRDVELYAKKVSSGNSFSKDVFTQMLREAFEAESEFAD